MNLGGKKKLKKVSRVPSRKGNTGGASTTANSPINSNNAWVYLSSGKKDELINL
jgi:hypothetical protein